MPSAKILPPTILIIFGVTGDLAKKKILPALAHLAEVKALPERFRVVGFSRRSWKDSDLRDYAQSVLKDAPPDGFLEKLSYVEGKFDDRPSYSNLSKALQAIDDEWGMCTNKLFYLAVPPIPISRF